MKDQRTKILDVLAKPISKEKLAEPLVVFDRLLRTINGCNSNIQETECSTLCRHFKILYPDCVWQYEHLCWVKHNHFNKLLVDHCDKTLKELRNIRYEHLSS